MLLYKFMMFWHLESCVCISQTEGIIWRTLVQEGTWQSRTPSGSRRLFDSKRQLQAHLEFYIQIKSHYFFLITQEQHVSTLSECSLNNIMFNTRSCLLCHKLQRHFSFLLKEWQMGYFCQHFLCSSAHKDRVASGNSGAFLFCTLFLLFPCGNGQSELGC